MWDKQTTFEFFINQLGLPYAFGMAWYGIRTYRGLSKKRDGTPISRHDTPYTYWTETIGTLGIAAALTTTGTLYLVKCLLSSD